MADGSTARRRAADGERVEVSGTFDCLPVESSRYVRKGHEVFTVGFPNVGLQGFAPKLSMGIVASLSGARDDFRSFQISNPIQPGNSGGALLDDKGNVIGVVTAKLSQAAAVATTGTLAENVNYAVKSSFLLGFRGHARGDGQTPATSNKGTEIIGGFSLCGKSHGAGTGLLTWWSEAFSCAGAKRRRGLRR